MGPADTITLAALCHRVIVDISDKRPWRWDDDERTATRLNPVPIADSGMGGIGATHRLSGGLDER